MTIIHQRVTPAKARVQVSNTMSKTWFTGWITAFEGITLFILAAGLVRISHADPSVQLRLEVTPKEITMGDHVTYRLTVNYDPALTPGPVSLPNPFGKFELMNQVTSQPKAVAPDKTEQEHILTFTTFSTGTLVLPSLAVVFFDDDGQRSEAATQPVTVKVISLLAKYGDEGGLRPLKGFFNFPSYLWLWVLLLVLLSMGLIYFIWKTKRKTKSQLFQEHVPQRPPEEIIWAVIQECEESNLLAEGQIKEFYSRLSSAVRVYLEQQFHISALDRTSTELYTEFRDTRPDPETLLLLKSFFESSDLVKFAKLQPSEDEIDSDLERVKRFVILTTPKKTDVQIKEEITV